MSWFWGSKSKKDDPTKSLDPDLKQFLDEQNPKPYIPGNAPQKSAGTAAPEPEVPAPRREDISPEDRPLPSQSLYQDGRYKHLWSTYVPQNEDVVATKSSAQRVMTAKKDRREMIHRAALENCAFEEEMKQNCFTSGDAVDRARARMTLCRQETKAFNRCYQLQAKFLQALGYLSSSETSSADEEIIQMHADKLYHRMMDYEAAVDDAKKNDTPVPPLSSVFNPTRPAPTIEEINLPASMEKSLKKPLRDLPPHERELAARAVLQEAKVAHLYVDDFFKYTTTLNEGRKERQQWLINAFGETLGKFFIPDPPQEHSVKAFKPDELERDFWKENRKTTSNATPDAQNKG